MDELDSWGTAEAWIDLPSAVGRVGHLSIPTGTQMDLLD
jgi:hypothetical protein